MKRQHGFTLIELVVVITILGILSAVVVPRIGNISPKYRLRSAARVIGSHIAFARSLSGGTGEEYVLRYDLENQLYWIILPPGPDEDPLLDPDERDTLSKFVVEEGILIEELRFPDGSDDSSGIVDVTFDRYGNEGSHIVVLKNEDEKYLSIKFSALIGAIDYFPEPIEFEEY